MGWVRLDDRYTIRWRRGDEPNKHDADCDGQGVYQPDKTEAPKEDYDRGKHEKMIPVRTTRKTPWKAIQIGVS